MFFDFQTQQLIREIEELEQAIAALTKTVHQNNARLAIIENLTRTDDQEIRSQLSQLLAIFAPHPAYVTISLGGTMPLTVGNNSVASVVVLDQFGNAMSGFDFAANPPAWGVSDPSLASLAADSSADTETVTATAPGSEVLSVTVPGVANGNASLSFTVAQAAPVATSVQITTSPDITG